MDLALNGKIALVTGGSRGLGRQSALSLAAEGVNVAICGRTRQTLDVAVSEIEKKGVDALGIEADVSDVKSMLNLHSEVESQLGPVDILVNNAGGSRTRTDITETDLEDFKGTFDLNLFGGFELMKLVIPSMKEQKWGRIVNIISEVFSSSVANFSAYVAAKGGQIGWSRSMARELASFGITVNMVGPGWIPVERHADDPQEDKDAYLAQIPMGRWGVPEDVAHAVRFFASEEASFVTGQTLYVNGGMTPW